MNYTQELIGTLLGSETVGTLSKASGAKSAQVESLIGAALPLMLEGMQKSAGTKKGEASLTQALSDHARSDTSSAQSFLAEVDDEDGAKILGHLFGDDTNPTVSALSKKAGLTKSQTASILVKLAPLLLSLLGQQNQNSSGGIGSILGSLLGGGSGTGSLIGSLLGSDTSDAAGSLIGSLLGGSGSSGSSSSGLSGIGGSLLSTLLGSSGSGSSGSSSSGLGGIGGSLLSALLTDDDDSGSTSSSDGGLLGSLLGGSGSSSGSDGGLLGDLLGGGGSSAGGLLGSIFGDDSQKSSGTKKKSSGSTKKSSGGTKKKSSSVAKKSSSSGKKTAAKRPSSKKK